MWDLATGREQRRFPQPVWGLGPLAVSPDEKTLVLAPTDRTVALVDFTTGKELRKLPEHDYPANGAAFAPDGRTLTVWYGDHTVRRWQVESGRELLRFPFAGPKNPHGQYMILASGDKHYFRYNAAASPDGRFLAYASQDKCLQLHDLATGKEALRLSDLPDAAFAVAFTADSRMLAWGGWRDPTVRLVEVATGQERHAFHGHQGGILSLTFADDGRTLISGGYDTSALVWDLTGRLGGEDWGKPLTPAELDDCWADLAGADVARAYRAVRRLASSPMEAVAYLRVKVRPVAAVDEQRLARLIADLDSDRFAVRESAEAELEALEETALAACRKALEGKLSAEVRRRLEALVEKASPTSSTRLRPQRALEALELIGSPEARQLLEALARGQPEARRTQDTKAALQRLSRRAGG
jgi:hypothetical protein